MSNHKIITADGITELVDENKAKSVTVYFSGNFGGGTLTIGYLDALDNFQGFADLTGVITYTSPNQRYVVGLGQGQNIHASLSGSTAPSIVIETRNVT